MTLKELFIRLADQHDVTPRIFGKRLKKRLIIYDEENQGRLVLQSISQGYDGEVVFRRGSDTLRYSWHPARLHDLLNSKVLDIQCTPARIVGGLSNITITSERATRR